MNPQLHVKQSLARHLPAPGSDFRTMLRWRVVQSVLAQLEAADQARAALRGAGAWRRHARRVQARFAASLSGVLRHRLQGPVRARTVSRHVFGDFSIENVVFESLPGWWVSATVWLPSPQRWAPPWRPIVTPVGHNAKTTSSEQIPAQLFAKQGFAVISFDPPGFGEKAAGNDHFCDGVKCYLLGENPLAFFVADALRAMDYLGRRRDVDATRGFAMTGVSGGGFTTICCAVIDRRVRILGPSCFGSPDADHPVANGYAGCPETLFLNRYAQGLGISDLLSATRFQPILLMGGRRDRVLTPARIGGLANAARVAYEGAGTGARVRLFIDDCGHEYSARQAEEFLRWVSRWWPRRAAATTASVGPAALLASSLLKCDPPRGLTIGGFVRREVRKLQAPDEQRMRSRLRHLVGLNHAAPRALALRRAHPVGIWSHELTEAVFRDGGSWEMPATILTRLGSTDGDLMLFFDDRGRWSAMHQWGWLMRALGMFEAPSGLRGLVTVDLPGWGDTRPAPSAWDVVGWGGTDRWMAYVSAASGDSVMAMRVREAVRCTVAACAVLGVSRRNVVLGGHGLGANVAACAALLLGSLRGLALVEPLASYASLAEASHAHWPHDAYFPGILSVGDFGDTLKLCRAPVLVANPLDAAGKPARRWASPARHISVIRDTDRATLESEMVAWVRRGRKTR